MIENLHGRNYELAKAEADKVDEQVTAFVSKLALALVRLTHLIKLLNGFNQISGRSTAARSKM